MCWSIAPTIFGRSITGDYEAGENTHVKFYANAVLGLTPGRPQRDLLSATGGRGLTAPRRTTRRSQLPDNWDDGSDDAGATGTGNGLVIPLLTDDFGSIQLLEGTDKTPNLLTDIRRALQPTAGRNVLRRAGAKSMGADAVVIREFGIYTLVLASRASLIPDAVNSPAVEPRKRPPANAEGFDALEQGYDCPVVVACFDNNDSGDAKPIAYAFTPRFKKRLLVYTTDGHDGKAPDLNAYVEMDHVLFAGSYRMQPGKGTRVNYRDTIPDSLASYVPGQVVGQVIPKGTMVLNGDVLLKTDEVARGIWNPQRVIPPNATPKRKPMPFADAIQTGTRKKPWR